MILALLEAFQLTAGHDAALAYFHFENAQVFII
jgi:hypothetical protein